MFKFPKFAKKWCTEIKRLLLSKKLARKFGSYKTSKQQKDSKLLKTTRFEVLLTKIQNKIRNFHASYLDVKMTLLRHQRILHDFLEKYNFQFQAPFI